MVERSDTLARVPGTDTTQITSRHVEATMTILVMLLSLIGDCKPSPDGKMAICETKTEVCVIDRVTGRIVCETKLRCEPKDGLWSCL
jgi:hypothetical protein